MADYIVDLGEQLYGRRKFALYNTVGDNFWHIDGEDTFCCWRDFDEHCRAQYGDTMRALTRRSPWSDKTDLSWIPENCGEDYHEWNASPEAHNETDDETIDG
jgi:hypothetical protein